MHAKRVRGGVTAGSTPRRARVGGPPWMASRVMMDGWAARDGNHAAEARSARFSTRSASETRIGLLGYDEAYGGQRQCNSLAPWRRPGRGPSARSPK